ncbi:MAG: efflux RND transporter periplasmic adaptor subunit [Zoogloea sp.]|nr:efflux RND transporter periplasmic adaptor subunit [Zoogloea sp.]
MKNAPFALTLVLALAGCGKEAPPPPPPRIVLVQQAAPASALADGALYTGEVRARYESDLGFRIAGKIVARRVDVGATVAAGTVLAELDPTDAALSAEAANAQLAAADTDLALARAELARYRDLVAKNFVSRSVLDAKEATWKAAAARAEQARAQARVAHNQAGYTRLVADKPGVVSAVFAEAGQVVKDGTPVVRLSRPGEKEVVIAVPESRLAQLRAAREVSIRLWSQPDRRLRGAIREIAPVADAATRTYAVKVRLLDDDPAVQLGMTASVILSDGGADAGSVLVPATAVFQQEGGAAVWVIKGARPVLRRVQVKQFREDGVLLSAGLKPGETIAVAGVHKLVADETVRPQLVASPQAQPAQRTGG